MSVHAISQAQQSAFIQSKQALQAVQSDLSSGNSSQAQTDFSTFQQAALSFFSSATSQQPASPQADLQTLQSDLSSGNVTGAQQALTAFQQATQSAQHQWGRGHHGHNWADGNQASVTPTTSNSATTSSATTSATGTAASTPASNLAALQSLLSAYQSMSGTTQALNAGSLLNLVG